MFRHEATLLFPVRVSGNDPNAACMIQEQFGGANGELKALVEYLVQSFGTTDPATRSLLLNIATEEASHLEMVGTAIVQLMSRGATPPGSPNLEPVTRATGNQLREAPMLLHKLATVGGVGPMATDSAGVPFTGAFLDATGDVTSNLASDVAAELRARAVYERLYRNTTDQGLRDMLQFLIEREATHSVLFSEALERVKDVGAAKNIGRSTVSRRAPAFADPVREMLNQYGSKFPEPPLKEPILEADVKVQLAEQHDALTPVG